LAHEGRGACSALSDTASTLPNTHSSQCSTSGEGSQPVRHDLPARPPRSMHPPDPPPGGVGGLDPRVWQQHPASVRGSGSLPGPGLSAVPTDPLSASRSRWSAPQLASLEASRAFTGCRLALAVPIERSHGVLPTSHRFRATDLVLHNRWPSTARREDSHLAPLHPEGGLAFWPAQPDAGAAGRIRASRRGSGRGSDGPCRCDG